MVARIFRRSSISNAVPTSCSNNNPPAGGSPGCLDRRSDHGTASVAKMENRRSMMLRRSVSMRGLNVNATSEDNTVSLQQDDTTTSASRPRVFNRRAMLGRSKSLNNEESDVSAPAEPATPGCNRRDIFKRSKSSGRGMMSGSFRNLMKLGGGGSNHGGNAQQEDSGSVCRGRGVLKRESSHRNIKRSISLKDFSHSGSVRNLMLGIDNDGERYQEPDRFKKEFLLDKLGGMAVLGSLVHDFEVRVINDERLQPFFKGVDHRILLEHQRRFFAMAFTEIGEPAVLSGTIRKSHSRLFYQGLSALHFDMVVQHLVDSLELRGFNDNIINQVTSTISPLRPIFEEEAEDFAMSKSYSTNGLGNSDTESMQDGSFFEDSFDELTLPHSCQIGTS